MWFQWRQLILLGGPQQIDTSPNKISFMHNKIILTLSPREVCERPNEIDIKESAREKGDE